MPFFKMLNQEQVRHYCENQSLDDLHALNRRYAKFFADIADAEKRNNQAMIGISAQISKTQEHIEENAQGIRNAEKFRQDILDNLPENAAERYLVLQHVNYNIDDQSAPLEEEMRQLNLEKNRLKSHNAWIHSEIRACAQESKIINAVIEEKEHAVNPKLKQPCIS